MNITIKGRNKISKYALMVIILAAIIVAQSCVLVYVLSTRGIDIPLPGPPLGDFINVRDKGATGDGTSNDSKAITLALKEAQLTGMDLYFPAGTYNLNNVNLWANENIRIFGDGKSTILYNPGIVYCYGNAAVENLSVFKRTGVFIYMKPTAYSDLYVNNVTVYNDLEAAEDCKPFYACINTAGENCGIDNLTFTNNNISKCQAGLMLLCEVRSGGIVANNTITDLGNPETKRALYGVALGVTDDDTNEKIRANNVTVSNNTISGMYAPVDSTQRAYGILVIGTNVKILDNRLENLYVWTGIYSKAIDLVIRGNTMSNAGYRNAITVKNWDAEDKDILIENNTISSVLTKDKLSNEDRAIAIRIEAPRFTIKNNNLSLYTQYEPSIESSAITFASTAIQNGIIEGNNIYTERSYALLVNSGVDGHFSVSGNTITQNMQAGTCTYGKLFYLKLVSDSSVVNYTKNTINLDRGIYLSYGTSLNQGSVLNLSGNTITATAGGGWLFTMAGMSCNMVGNTLTLNANPESDNSTVGLLQGGASPVPYRVEGNTIYCNAPDMSYLFSMPTSFTMTGNQIWFAPDSKLLGIVTYSPEADAASGEVTTITKNTIGDITSVLRGDMTADESVANADYLVRFNTAKGYTFPNIVISENSAIVKLRLINRTTSGGGLPSLDTVSVMNNLIHSTLYSAEQAVIDTKLKERHLILESNISLMAAAEQAAAAEEAERLVAEQAAAAEEAERLAAEETERFALAEEVKLETERAAAEAAERALLKAEAEDAAKIETETAEQEKEAAENEKNMLPAGPSDFIYYATKDGYLILQFATEVKGASDRCVTIDGKTYKTQQYDTNSIIVDVKLNTGQLKNNFNVTAKVIISDIDAKKVQSLTKSFTK